MVIVGWQRSERPHNIVAVQTYLPELPSEHLGLVWDLLRSGDRVAILADGLSQLAFCAGEAREVGQHVYDSAGIL